LKYDAVVIGAGPAGSTAACEIAQAGHSVLMVERRERPGSPVYCAEAVSRPSFEKLLRPERGWISAFIEKILIFGPNGSKLELFHKEAGYILERSEFDYDLARRAVKAGSRLECRTIGLGLIREGDLFRSIELLKPTGERTTVEASIFIAADGVESGVARSAGINNGIELDEVESLLQYRLEEISVDPESAEFHMGNRIAPKGYIWVFPKSATSANVGLGISTHSKRSEELEVLLRDFIDRRFGGGRIAARTCGMVPKYQGRDRFRSANLLVAGDAARTLDSLTGAGVINAVMSGRFAGQAAAAYISGGLKAIDEIEHLYPRKFLAVKGEELATYLRLRNVYKNLSDDDFADIIAGLNEYFVKNSVYGVNAGKLLIGLITTRPRLLRLIKHLL
jgi:digeranylgeranylglycerophospholipid reductase